MKGFSYDPTAMCYACESRLTPAFEMPEAPRRREPTGPQYFTFDPIPEAEPSPPLKKGPRSLRSKKRSRRVLYPPVAKRYYPTEEPNYAKRLLFILLTVVLFQIYSAEEELPATFLSLSPGEENASRCSVAESRGSRGEPLRSQEPEPAAPATATGIHGDVVNATSWQWAKNETSESMVDITRLLEQSPAAF